MRRPAEEIESEGCKALLTALGPAGLVRFLQQMEPRRDDYTRDRHKWLGDLTIDEIYEEILEMRKGEEQDQEG